MPQYVLENLDEQKLTWTLAFANMAGKLRGCIVEPFPNYRLFYNTDSMKYDEYIK